MKTKPETFKKIEIFTKGVYTVELECGHKEMFYIIGNDYTPPTELLCAACGERKIEGK